MPLAFFRPAVHQSSRSTYDEFRELVDVLIDAAVLDRSLSLRSLRSPTFSVSGPVQERSAVNMFVRSRKPKWSRGKSNKGLWSPHRTSERLEKYHDLHRPYVKAGRQSDNRQGYG
jgi:hypothetical protein